MAEATEFRYEVAAWGENYPTSVEMIEDLGPISDPQSGDKITVKTRISPAASFIWIDTKTGELYFDWKRMHAAA